MNPLLLALVGGLLIGASAAALLLLRGQVAGISGAFGNLVLGQVGDGAWRVAFIAGLLAAIPLYAIATGAHPPIELQLGPAGAIVAGLLVGAGTARGNGCTSGHGVCGLANLSKRSLVATITFMAVAALTVFVRRHVIGG
jgi:hypothetical protein